MAGTNMTSDTEFIYRSAPGNADDPTLLLLHGTGGNETSLWELGQMLHPGGAGMLGVRGKVLENGMPRYFRRLAEGVFDLEDLVFRTNELADFVLRTAPKNAFEVHNIVAVGYSNGANIAAAMLLLRPEVLSGAVLFHPQIPLTPSSLPDLTDKKIWIGAGRRDPIVPADQTTALTDLLERAGANVTTFWQPGGHDLTPEEAEAAHQWLAERWQMEERDTQ